MNSLLNEIQQKLKVPKGQFNSFAKYHYRNAEDILEAVKPLLVDKGTLVLWDEAVQVGERYYIKATAELYDGENTHKVCAYAREELEKKGMDAAQITGAASSYARKYALNGLFCIDDTKDADTPEPPQNGAKQATTATKDPKRIQAAKDRIMSLLKLLNLPHKTLDECVASIRQAAKLELQEANYDLIGDRLAAILEEANKPKK
jgi:hypothetical protein